MEARAGSAETRKTVTVLFCDLVGSTALGESIDPEVLHRILARYFETARAAIERHGGTVEKFIGDAIMAAFGMPVVHEDDALRAVRAAVEVRAGVEELNGELDERIDVRLEARIGVYTGEVVAADDPSGKTLFGDAVNTAARLEQAAGAGEILIGDPTHRLVAGAVRAEPVEPVAAKGKTEPVAAWRLLALIEGAEAIPRRFDLPFVGRKPELAALREALEQAVAHGVPRLVTVLGEAGIGKTRLVSEFAAGARMGARVLTGRCPSYGDGLTYWPLRELVDSIGVGGLDELDERERTAITGAVGLGGEPLGTDEVFPAVRKLVELLARGGPMCLVFEDIHWAEPTFLDLLQYLVELASGPVLLVCVARPELLDERPGWGAEAYAVALIRLPPLTAEDTEALVESLVDDLAPELRAAVSTTSQGNPLFLEQLTASAAETGEVGELPATIQAVLDARLGRLDPDERATLERAAVLAVDFDEQLLAPLTPPEQRGRLSRQLVALTRKQLLRVERAARRPYGFHHGLIQEAAYRSVPKVLRAVLHEAVADLFDLDTGPGEATGPDALIGHHLASAHRYRTELGEDGEAVTALARRAAQRLAAAGRRALARADMRAAGTLLEHAIALEDDTVRGCELRLDIVAPLFELGRVDDANRTISEALVLAQETELPALEWRVRVARASHDFERSPAHADAVIALGEEAFQVARAAGDDLGAVRAAQLVSDVYWAQCRLVATAEAAQRALPHARALSAARDEARLRASISAATFFDLVTPAPEHQLSLDADLAWARERGNRFFEAMLVGAQAHVLAEQGQFEEARTRRTECVALFRELGTAFWEVNHPAVLEVDERAGDLEAAEAAQRTALAVDERTGFLSQLAWVTARLAELLLDQGRVDEVDALLRRSEATSGADDVGQQVMTRALRARLLVAGGDAQRAEPIARDAMSISSRTDMAELHRRAREALAAALAALGQRDQAAALLREVVTIWERKGFVVRADRAREQLERLGG